MIFGSRIKLPRAVYCTSRGIFVCDGYPGLTAPLSCEHSVVSLNLVLIAPLTLEETTDTDTEVELTQQLSLQGGIQ